MQSFFMQKMKTDQAVQVCRLIQEIISHVVAEIKLFIDVLLDCTDEQADLGLHCQHNYAPKAHFSLQLVKYI